MSIFHKRSNEKIWNFQVRLVFMGPLFSQSLRSKAESRLFYEPWGGPQHFRKKYRKTSISHERRPSQLNHSRLFHYSPGPIDWKRFELKSDLTLGVVPSSVVKKNQSIFLYHLQGDVESIAMMKPIAANEHEQGFLEYLEDIIGTERFKKPLELLNLKVEELSAMWAEKVRKKSEILEFFFYSFFENFKRKIESKQHKTKFNNSMGRINKH